MIDWVMMFVLCILLILAIGLPLRARNKWKGRWKHAASLPLMMLGLVFLNIIIGTTLDSTSHNLFPFEILLWSLGSLGFMALCSIVRYFLPTHQTHT